MKHLREAGLEGVDSASDTDTGGGQFMFHTWNCCLALLCKLTDMLTHTLGQPGGSHCFLYSPVGPDLSDPVHGRQARLALLRTQSQILCGPQVGSLPVPEHP